MDANQCREFIKNLTLNPLTINNSNDLFNIELEEVDADYSKDVSSLDTESDPQVASYLAIIKAHEIMYNYFATLTDRIITSSEEMTIKAYRKYYVNLAKDLSLLVNFQALIRLWQLEAKINKILFVGIDCEFTDDKIKLIQLNFEHSQDQRSFIWLLDPTTLNEAQNTDFIKYLICNPGIRKIFHGSESKDIPYFFDVLLNHDVSLIKKFNHGYIDTKYLCEYYRLVNDTENDRCSIYYGVHYFDVINDVQYSAVEDNIQKMGHVQEIVWNINNLSNAQINYAYYDVIYLKYFYFGIIYKATINRDKALYSKNVSYNERDIYTLYHSVLFELTQFMSLEKFKSSEGLNITNLTMRCKEQADPMNNYFIIYRNKRYKLLDLFNKIIENLTINNPKVDITTLFQIKYFKTYLTTILKKIAYTCMDKNYNIYINNSKTYDGALDNGFVFTFFMDNKFPTLNTVFREIERVINGKLSQLIQ